jgi:hypothetical protein
MEYTIENRGEYILVSMTGKWDINALKPGFPNLLDILREVRISRILVDGRELTGPFSRIDRYYVNVWLASVNVEYENKDNKPLKIAAVLDKTLLDPERFGEMVARNHGLTMYSTSDIEEAYKWLDVTPSKVSVRVR